MLTTKSYTVSPGLLKRTHNLVSTKWGHLANLACESMVNCRVEGPKGESGWMWLVTCLYVTWTIGNLPGNARPGWILIMMHSDASTPHWSLQKSVDVETRIQKLKSATDLRGVMGITQPNLITKKQVRQKFRDPTHWEPSRRSSSSI